MIEVTYKGKFITTLDESLLKERGLSDSEIEQLVKYYQAASIIENGISSWVEKHGTEYSSYLKVLAKLWESVQDNIQKLEYGKVDKNRVRFWILPYCTCPKDENEALYPNGGYKKSEDCLLHGVE